MLNVSKVNKQRNTKKLQTKYSQGHVQVYVLIMKHTWAIKRFPGLTHVRNFSQGKSYETYICCA